MASSNSAAVDQAATSAANDAKTFVDRASDAVSSGFSDAADFVVDQVHGATDRGGEAASWAGEQLDMLRAKVQDEPIKALAITAGIGAVLGLLFLRR